MASGDGCAAARPPSRSHGACQLTEWFCMDYVGDRYESTPVQQSCGTSGYLAGGCDRSRTNYVGGCRNNCGEDGEVFWAFFAPPKDDPATIRASQRKGCLEKGNVWVDP